MVKVAPRYGIAPLGDAGGDSLSIGQLAVYSVYVIVRWHGLKDARWPKRAFRAQIAPPEYRLDSLGRAQSPMQSQHLPKLRVDAALYSVVGGREAFAEGQPIVQIGKQMA